ncbi:DoxX family protein [Hufsiella ginkgonis]|uniref:DoxX family protein n=1 Tax=Hufsiella ginkgonis TaxID=2695274 RepID=A0A7K1XUT7_9SPHI|nr:DoxX family protein [Hufsiella ginkgonis]MXV14558.1 DoxX family protein [Hufsiella ginkgonis]
MKTIKITYWATTGIVALMMLFSAYAYLTNPDMAAAFQHLGFPQYFRVELAIGKLIGAVLLLAPVPPRVKEWVYAAFGINFISAVIAHTASGDPGSAKVMPLVLLALLVTSYVMYHKKAKA